MTDSLLQAYLPLFFWTGLGAIVLRFLPDTLPRLLGRSLYWVGVPLEILALARQTNFTGDIGLAPLITIAALVLGLLLAWLALHNAQRWAAADVLKTDRSHQGSFLLSSMIGNTGFVGLAIAPVFVSQPYLSWVIFYSVTHNVVGTYGIGVWLASYFGRSVQPGRWAQVRDVLTVPSLWAFALGASTQSIALPEWMETGLQGSVWLVIPAALLLMGMRLSQLQGWKSLRLAIVPMLLKSLVIPGLMGVVALAAGIDQEARLAIVLMAGMPTAFAGLILAEEYELDRELIASGIVLTSVALLFTIPLWLVLVGQGLPGFW